MDIQKSIYGYPKIELWISKDRFMDIRKWGIKSKTAPNKILIKIQSNALKELFQMLDMNGQSQLK